MPDLVIAQHWTDEEAHQFCADILTTAVEAGHYGIGYWADCEVERDENGYIYQLHNIRDAEDGEQIAEWLPAARIWSTLSAIANRQYDSKVNRNYLDWIKSGLADKETADIDAEAADIIVQLALFNEIVYG